MKKIILGIFVFMSFLSNAQEYKIEDNALTGIFEAKGKTKPQSIQRDLTAARNSDLSPLRLDRLIDVSYNENSLQSKYDVVFDVNGNETLYIEYIWNSDSQSLIPNYKNEYTYDANGNQTLSIYYSWNTDSQSLIPNSKNEYTYDANGNNNLSIGYSWNTDTQSFIPNGKNEFTYDANGNQTLSINYYWDTDTQSFVLSGKSEFTYDANGNQTLSLGYSWDTDTQSFVLSGQYVSTYDANGNPSSNIYYYNFGNGFFVPSYVIEYTYDANGNQTLSNISSINIGGPNSPLFRNEFTYDANGNQTLAISYNFNPNIQIFLPTSKSEFTYDANGNLTLFIYYDWNTDTQSFVPLFKEVRTYNNGLPITFLNQLIVYKWYSDLGLYKPSFKTEYSTIIDNDTQLHRKGVLYQYDTNFNVWNAFVGDEYNSYEYYTKTALSTETIDIDLISLYPNPTADLLYVSHPELNSLDIQITDLSGRQMYSGAIQKEVPFNVSSYGIGIYLVTIENKETNKKKTYKVIKK